jgi:WD40 repeat protein
MTVFLAYGLILASQFWDELKPIDLDALPHGAIARLGSARYDGEAELSPDGKTVAVVPGWPRKRSNCINIHDAETGKHLRTLRPIADQVKRDRSSGISYIRFVSATKLLAMSIDSSGRTADGLYLFDIHTGKSTFINIEGDFKSDYTPIECVSDDGKLMIGRHNTTLNVWQTKPFKQLNAIEPLHQTDPWFKSSRDVSTLVCGGKNMGEGNTDFRLVQVWDTATGKERSRIEIGELLRTDDIGISPHGDQLAALTTEGIVVYETKTGKRQFRVPYEPSQEDYLSYDYSGRRIKLYQRGKFTVISASDGKKLREYSISLEFPRNLPSQVEFLENGKARALFMFADPSDVFKGHCGEVRDLETGNILGFHPGHGCSVVSLRFSADGRRLISGAESGYQTWYKITDDAIGILRNQQVPQAVLTKLEALRNKEFSETKFKNEIAKVLTADELAQFKEIIDKHSMFGIAAASTLTWDLTNSRTRSLKPVEGTEFIPRGSLALDGKRQLIWEMPNKDGALNVELGLGHLGVPGTAELVGRDPKTAKEIYRIKKAFPLPQQSYGPSIALSPDKKSFVIYYLEMVGGTKGAVGSGTFSIYDAETGQPIHGIKLEKVRGVGGAFSLDGNSLFLAAHHSEKDDGIELLVIDTKTGKVKHRRDVRNTLTHAENLADNKTALLLFDKTRDMKDQDLLVQNWDTQADKFVGTWSVKNEILSCACPTASKDTSLLAFTTRDWANQKVFIRVLQTESLKERCIFPWPVTTDFPAHHVEYPTSLAISPDNKILAVGLTNGTILLYDLQVATRNPRLK